MRIAVGQLWQETNTFNRNLTRWSDFEAMGVAEGPDILDRFSETGELSGFLQAFRETHPDTEFVGLSRFACWPWGSVAAESWQQIRDSFAKQFDAAGQLDAVYLTLHGAVCAEDEPDVTGAILELAQQVVGPDVPVVGSLDLHANITPRMTSSAYALAGYHACPHIDGVETGARAARALLWSLKTGRRPVTYTHKLPMITAAESHNTFTGIPAPLYRQLEELERRPGVLTAGLYMAMPWFDCPELGWTITLTVEEASDEWQPIVDELAAEAWELRTRMEDVDRLTPTNVVDRALSIDGHPVVIGDGADATNSGAPGDSTILLAEFLRRESIPHGALTFLIDADAVHAAQQSGEGGAFEFALGGKLSEYSEPLQFKGTVEKLLDVKWVLSGHICNNLPIDMGAGAIVRSGDVTVLLCERSGPGSSPVLYESSGLNPRDFGIVVAKSPAGFRADYESFAAGMLSADCPGCAAPRWNDLQFNHVNRPLWPLDPIDSPAAAEWAR